MDFIALVNEKVNSLEGVRDIGHYFTNFNFLIIILLIFIVIILFVLMFKKKDD